MTPFNRHTFTTFCGLLSAATVVVQQLKSDAIFTFLSTGYSPKGPLTLQSTAVCAIYTALYFPNSTYMFRMIFKITSYHFPSQSWPTGLHNQDVISYETRTEYYHHSNIILRVPNYTVSHLTGQKSPHSLQ